MKEYMIESKSEFARMLNVPVQTYIKWENGESSPNLDLAFTIAKKLNRTVIDIWYQI
ncbi:MAG: helix-turn-helix domain-containing protein [Peptostreptococcaceae bacterium]|nr:helix-turn-helix domain-containing protein [Peptostreptococcaceae bacterium]